MEGKSLEERVTLLENELRGLPAQVGALGTQVTAVTARVAEFRDEVRDKFDDVRGEIAQFREEIRVEFAAVRAEMGSMRDDLRNEIKNGDDETRRLMRVLHEDLVTRIALIDRG